MWTFEYSVGYLKEYDKLLSFLNKQVMQVLRKALLCYILKHK